MEQLTLESVAQTLMDLYYKDFKQSGDFFDYEHFEFLARAIWGKLLDAEAKEWRKVARQESGFWTIDLPGDWLVSETVGVKPKENAKRSIAVLKDVPYSFSFDRHSWGIQSVYSEEHRLERITIDGIWKIRHLPPTDIIFWYPQQQHLHFLTENEINNVEVAYLPSLTNGKAAECSLPVAKLFDITTMGLQVMLNVKNGVVDMTNNQNPNAVLQTEVDNVFSNIKTKSA